LFFQEQFLAFRNRYFQISVCGGEAAADGKLEMSSDNRFNRG
jgi:hypothetical protein